jgi:hypothetical protein
MIKIKKNFFGMGLADIRLHERENDCSRFKKTSKKFD